MCVGTSLHQHLIEHLNAEIVLGTISDVSVSLEWLRSTFLYIRVNKNPKHYGSSSGIFTYIHPLNGPLSGTTQVSWYQKGKTNLDFTEARDSEWQRHQMGHMQVCTSLQTDNHASTPPLGFSSAMLCIRGTSHGPVSVCLSVRVRLSQVGVLSKRMNESGWFLARELHSTYPTLCYKEIHVPSKIRVLPSGILLQTLDLENFATAYRSSKRVVNLARER